MKLHVGKTYCTIRKSSGGWPSASVTEFASCPSGQETCNPMSTISASSYDPELQGTCLGEQNSLQVRSTNSSPGVLDLVLDRPGHATRLQCEW